MTRAPGSAVIVADAENVRSPAAASGATPSSNNCWLALPPTADRSAVTTTLVLSGLVPGVTATVSVVVDPLVNVFGVAVPAPLGFVAVGGWFTAPGANATPRNAVLPAAVASGASAPGRSRVLAAARRGGGSAPAVGAP